MRFYENPVFLKMKEYVDLSNAGEVDLLIDDLDLEMMGYRDLNN